MDIRAVAFDANGTLVKILTEEGMEDIFRAAAHFLTYQGIDLCRQQVRELYFRILAEQQDASPEQHPEFDAAIRDRVESMLQGRNPILQTT